MTALLVDLIECIVCCRRLRGLYINLGTGQCPTCERQGSKA